MTTILRPYQQTVIEEFHRRVEAGIRRIILVAPTGSGKTIIGADIIHDYARRAKAVMVLAHRREIIAQTSQKLFDVGISHGIIQAGVKPRPLEFVQVASIQTLWRRTNHAGTIAAGRSFVDRRGAPLPGANLPRDYRFVSRPGFDRHERNAMPWRRSRVSAASFRK